MKKLTLKEGEELVHAARNAIELTLKSPIAKKTIIYESVNSFDWPSGAFVTLYHYPTDALRGCVGFPRHSTALGRAVVDSAISAAFGDPRFVSISFNELTELIIEVSILSELEPIIGTEKEKLKSVKIGRDGLMVEYGIYSGLLLPAVAVEEKWDAEEFLNAVCEKAGIPEEYWKQKNVKLYKFTTQVFKEEEPMGKVTEVKLSLS